MPVDIFKTTPTIRMQEKLFTLMEKIYEDTIELIKHKDTNRLTLYVTSNIPYSAEYAVTANLKYFLEIS
jgi:hypothetical protein